MENGNTADFISRKVSGQNDGTAAGQQGDDENAYVAPGEDNQTDALKPNVWKRMITVRDAVLIALVAAFGVAIISAGVTASLFLLNRNASTPAPVSPERNPETRVTVTVDGHTVETGVDGAATTHVTVTSNEQTVVASVNVVPPTASVPTATNSAEPAPTSEFEQATTSPETDIESGTTNEEAT